MKVAQIYIVGSIGDFTDENGERVRGVHLEDVITQINANKDADKYIVKIKSPGGDYDLGFDIYNYIKSIGKPVDTMAIGMVASMGSVLFMAGENRIMTPEAQVLIHNPWTSPHGAYEAQDLEMLAADLKSAEKELLDFYVKTTGNTKEAIAPLMKVETIMTPERAKNLGFATEVLVEMPKAIAYRKSDKSDKMNNNESKSILAKIAALINGDKPKVKNLLVNVADGQLDFYELDNDVELIPIGSKATFNGEPATGEYIDEGGRVYVFEGEVLQDIRMQEEESTEEEMDIEAMKTEIIDSVLTAVDEKFKALADQGKAIEEKLEEREEVFAGLKTLIGKEVEEVRPNPERSKDKQREETSVFARGFANRKNK